MTNSDAHQRLFASIVLAAVVAVVLRGRISPFGEVFVTWDSFSLSVLCLDWMFMLTANPQEVRRRARINDSTRTVIFVLVIVSACASLLALAVLLGTARGLPKGRLTEHVLLSVGTVSCSWLLVHTVFALRYAHSFYAPGSKGEARGGLDFPGEKAPDYLDFAYFSFVIGMTCQVSDVQVTSRSIRRLALVHGCVSFVFNSAILALSVNIISGLLS